MLEACFDVGGVFLCWRRVSILEACFDVGGVF